MGSLARWSAKKLGVWAKIPFPNLRKTVNVLSPQNEASESIRQPGIKIHN
jgi:hypothetical protein